MSNKKINIKLVGINNKKSLKKFVKVSTKRLTIIASSLTSKKEIREVNKIKNFIERFGD